MWVPNFKKVWNKLLCKLELHDWYKGMFSIYCTREDCHAVLPNVGTDFDGIDCDDT